MVFHKSIPEGGKHFTGERMELIYGQRFDDEYNLRTGCSDYEFAKARIFRAAYHNDQYCYIKDQFDYYISCRDRYGAYRAGILVKSWLANRKDFLFFRGNDLFLSKEPVTLCP